MRLWPASQDVIWPRMCSFEDEPQPVQGWLIFLAVTRTPPGLFMMGMYPSLPSWIFSIPVSYSWKSKREKMVAIVRYSSAQAKLRCGEKKISVGKGQERTTEPDERKDVKLTVDLGNSSCLVQKVQSTAPVLSSPMCRGTARARKSTNLGRWSRRGKWKNASC